MKRSALFAAVCLPALVAAAGTSAKTLVYCSEGSPENFYPGDQHHRHLVRRQQPDLRPASSTSSAAATKVVPGLAEKWDISATARSTPSTSARA